ncbi:hypothetical protein EOL70_01665 [Leucothrix sargassi]|nr:hypothetical protein EOL70_01665 [Leucothrix sargassi]
MSNPPSKASEYIPVVSDLVVPGNPALRQASNAAGQAKNKNYVDDLNSRIDELESAIGQDTMGSQSRAYAIRAEANRKKTPPVKKLNGGNRNENDKQLS